MASSVATRRPVIGILFIVAGALILLALLLTYIAPGLVSAWFGYLCDIALGLAFLFLFLGRGGSTILRAAFIVTAVGWFLLFLCGIIPGLSVISLLAELAVFVGSLASGILVYIRSFFSRSTNLWFLIAMVITALWMLVLLTGISAVLYLLLTLLFGAALVVAGLFILQRH